MTEPRKSPVRPLSVINPNDKLAQLRDAFAAESPTPARPAPPAEGEGVHAAVVDALRTVYDPEIPVNVYDLGLIYAIEADADGRVNVRMTLTAPGCPVADDILADVKRKVEAIDAVSRCDVDLVFDPPWTKDRMTEAALLELGLI